MFLSNVGSLPHFEGEKEYPYSHIDNWFKVQIELGFDVIGTGEPGWREKYSMIERFTRDLGGFEIIRIGNQFKTRYMGKITPPENIDDVKEVIENKYLRRIAGKKAVLKATVTDPVSIVCGLDNFMKITSELTNILWDVTDALKPIVKALDEVVDIVQFDCPIHSYNPTRDPWQYVDELVNLVKGRRWLHICGPLKRIFTHLVSKGKYKVDVLHCHLFGKEEEENFKTIEDNLQEFIKSGKKIGAGVVNTAIQDLPQQVDSVKTIVEKMKHLERLVGQDKIAALSPGCGLTLLPKTTHLILERVAEAHKRIRA